VLGMRKGMDKKRLVYLDNAATTKPAAAVVEAMLPFLTEEFGNPSGLYELATRNKKAVNQARRQIASLLGCDHRELFFTSGGTESDNWALVGAAEHLEHKGKHIITSSIEHHAILHSCDYLKKRGFEITCLPVGEDGKIDPKSLVKAMRDDTILVSLMYANNEIGTIQPIAELCKIAHERGVLFHTDAVQAVGQIPMDVKELGVDLLSMSSHKLHGPKGVGALYIKEGIRLQNFQHGGAQERGRRAGTENVPAIVGFGKAAELATERLEAEKKAGRITEQQRIRDYLIDRVMTEIPYARLTGHRTQRLPGNASFCFQFTEGETLLILLDMEGICASSGSACTTGSREPSHVLTAIGLPPEVTRGSIRLTLSHETTQDEIDYTVEKMKEIIAKARSLSQDYADMIRKR